MNQPMRYTIIAAVLATGLAAAAHAEDINITTSHGTGADTFAYSVQPDTPQGAQVYVDAKSVANVRLAYFRFDLSSVDVDTITNATFKLAAYYTAAAVTIEVYGLTNESLDAWDEATLTWNNAPARAGNVFDSQKVTLLGTFDLPFIPGPAAQSVNFTSTALVNFLKTDTNGKVSILLRVLTADKHVRFASKENVSGYAVPALLLTKPDIAGTIVMFR